MTEIKIDVGLNPETGKWHAAMLLPSGEWLFTEGFETRGDCRKAVDDWLRDACGVDHTWREAMS